MTGDEKHSAAANSTLDVLWVLYDRILHVSPATIDDPARDRFYLSKGHGPMAYYATLAAKGYIPVEWLERWASYGSPLGYHPDRNLVPGVEISSGSLGHGLPLAVGTVLGLKAEAVELAGALGLEALTVVVVDNESSTYNRPGRIERWFGAEGWNAVAVDGRNHAELELALKHLTPGRPSVVVAHVEGTS